MAAIPSRPQASTVVPFLCLCACLNAFAAGEISGRILNGTTGKPMPSFEFYVMQPGAQGLRPVKTLRTDAQGKFTAADIPDLAQSPHILQAEYHGVNYNHTLRPMGPMTDIELAVYETTDSMDGFRVSLPHMMIRNEGGVLRVDEVYQVENDSSPKKSYVSAQGSFRFYLPKEMTKLAGVSITSAGSTLPVQQTPSENSDGEGYNVTNPLKPGRTQVRISYEIDYSKKHLHLVRKFYHPLESFNLFLSPEDIQATSNLLKEGGKDTQNTGFRMLSAGAVPAKTEVSIDLSGGSSREPDSAGAAGAGGAASAGQNTGARITLIPPTIARYRFVIIVNLFIVLALCMAWRLMTPDSPSTPPATSSAKRKAPRRS